MRNIISVNSNHEISVSNINDSNNQIFFQLENKNYQSPLEFYLNDEKINVLDLIISNDKITFELDILNVNTNKPINFQIICNNEPIYDIKINSVIFVKEDNLICKYDLESNIIHITKSNIFNYVANEIFNQIFPIGRGFIDHTNTDYSNYLGFSWERCLIGMTPVGLDKNEPQFNEIGKTGGEKEHLITINEIPSHYHQFEDGGRVLYWDSTLTPMGGLTNGSTVQSTWNAYTKKAGGDRPHNNMQPYEIVNFWKRIA